MLVCLIDLSSIYWTRWHTVGDDQPADTVAKETVAHVQRLAAHYSNVAVCCDSPGGSWRNDIYADYKGNRPEKPAGAKEQLERTIRILRGQGFLILQEPNCEADDAIASA